MAKRVPATVVACAGMKLLFCGHRAIKLTQNCACFTNPCINSHVQSLGNTTVLGLITNGIDVSFMSPRVKELGPEPIHPQMRSRRKVGSPISVVITNGGKMANPPWQTKFRNRDALS